MLYKTCKLCLCVYERVTEKDLVEEVLASPRGIFAVKSFRKGHVDITLYYMFYSRNITHICNDGKARTVKKV